MAVEIDVRELEAKYLEVKKLAGENSANVIRFAKELGAAQDEIVALKAQLEGAAVVQAALEAANAKAAGLEKELAKAGAAVAKGEQAVAAAKAVAENLAALSAL